MRQISRAARDTKPYDAGQGWSVPVTEKQGLMSAVSLRIHLQLVVGYKTNKAFRRLQAILEQPHAPVSS